MPDLMYLANPRKRKKRRIRRRRILKNPVRLALRPSRREKGSIDIIGSLIPIGAGVGTGLFLPKILNLKGVATWLVPIGAGILSPMFLTEFIGRRNATLLGAGFIASSVVRALDELIFKPQKNPLLAENMKDITENVEELESPLIAATSQEIPELEQEESELEQEELEQEEPELEQEELEQETPEVYVV